MKSHLLLFNPSSGGGRSLKKKKEIISSLKNAGLSVDVVVTESESHLRGLIPEAVGKYGALLGVGGDTTFTIMVSELLKLTPGDESSPSLGFIPTGSANDISRGLGIYPIKRAIDAIKRGRVRPMDVGKIRDLDSERTELFLGSCSGGLGVSVNRFIDAFYQNHPRLKPFLKITQFFTGLLAVRDSFRTGQIPKRFGITDANGKETHCDYSLWVGLNNPYYANGLKLIGDCSPFDGSLDMAVIHTAGFWQTLRFYMGIGEKKITHIRGDRFLLNFPERGAIQIDGEVFGGFHRAEIEILRGAVDVFCP